MGVEPQGDQHPVRCEVCEERFDDGVHGASVDITGRTCRQWDVAGSPDAGSVAGVIVATGAGIERPLVARDVQHVGVGIENLLGSVAVMGVDIDDRYPVPPRSQLTRHHRDVIQQAESHRLRRACVVAGRSHREKCALGQSRGMVGHREGIDGGQSGAGRGDRGRPRSG